MLHILGKTGSPPQSHQKWKSFFKDYSPNQSTLNVLKSWDLAFCPWLYLSVMTEILPNHPINTLKFCIHFHLLWKTILFQLMLQIAQCLANVTRCRKTQKYKISPLHFFLSPFSYKTIQQCVLLLHYQSLACRSSLNNNANICSVILHLRKCFLLLENPFQYWETVITCDRVSCLEFVEDNTNSIIAFSNTCAQLHGEICEDLGLHPIGK